MNIKLTFALLPILFIAGCAYTTVEPVAYDSKEEGLRVYDPGQMFIITCDGMKSFVYADLSRGYAIETGAVLAKNKTNITVTEGLLTTFNPDLDDTAPIDLLKALGEKAIDNAEKLSHLMGADIGGKFPGMEGIWILNRDVYGNASGLKQIASPTKPCEPINSTTSTNSPIQDKPKTK